MRFILILSSNEERKSVAYERLLLDPISGDASPFTRRYEIEVAWALVDPLTNGEQQAPIYNYDPQSEALSVLPILFVIISILTLLRAIL